MAENAEVIKSFLVGLGYKVDESSQRKFANSIAIQTEAVHGLADAIKETALKVINFTRNVVESMASLYFTSQQTKASAENIRALGYAADQTGSSASAMAGSLQNLRNKIRSIGENNAVAWLQNFGVQATDANGKILDTADLLLSIKKRMGDLDRSGQGYLSKMLGDAVGMDLGTQLADYQTMLDKANEKKAKDRAAGLNVDDIARTEMEFDNRWKSIKDTLKTFGERIAVDLSQKFSAPLDGLEKWFTAHIPAIEKLINSLVEAFGPFIDVLVKVAGIAGDVFGKLLDWFNSLSPSTKKVIATLVLLAGVAATLLVGFAALLPVISAVATVVAALTSPVWGTVAAIAAAVAIAVIFRKEIAAAAQTLVDTFGPACKAAASILTDTFKTAIDVVKEMFGAVVDLFTGRLDHLAQRVHSIGDKIGGFWERTKSAVGGVGQKIASSYQGYTSNPNDPRGIRNNNPGNINFAGQAGATKEAGAGGRFAVFQNAQDGLNALAQLLRNYASHGINTVKAIINKYAPAGDNNPVARYIQSVAKKLGVGMDQQLNLGDASQLSGLMSAIIQFENGKNPYSSEMLAKAAERSGASASTGSVTIHQQNTTTVTGSSDPKAAADAVGQTQQKANNQLNRVLRPRIQ